MRFIPVPTVKFVYILFIPVILLLFSVFLPSLYQLFILSDICILIFAALDLFKAYNNIFISVEIDQDKYFYMNQPDFLEIKIDSENKEDIKAELYFDLPRFWSSESGQEYLIRNSQQNIIKYPLTALRRGKFLFKTLHIRFFSDNSFFRFYTKVNVNKSISVYPDYRPLKKYFHLARSNRLYEMGIHRNRYRGHGTEMESLREYTKDDDSRFIDWKATARHNRPVTKVFEMETTNDIVFAMDCGRLMTSEEKNLSSIDHAIQALLVLAHTAVSMGDRIRVVAFSDRIIGDFSPPRNGNPINKIISFITPIQPEFTESNYSLVFKHLQSSIKKRSLIIFVSDFIDDINYSLFKKHFIQLGKRNVVLFLLLRDSLLHEEAGSNAESVYGIFRTTAARSMYVNRVRVLFKLKQLGINVLDVLPGQVTDRLVDKYLQLKSDNRI